MHGYEIHLFVWKNCLLYRCLTHHQINKMQRHFQVSVFLSTHALLTRQWRWAMEDESTALTHLKEELELINQLCINYNNSNITIKFMSCCISLVQGKKPFAINVANVATMYSVCEVVNSTETLDEWVTIHRLVHTTGSANVKYSRI